MQIDKNIPMPQSSNAGRPSAYPFREMNIGDSIFVEGQSTANSSVYRAAHSFGRARGWKFSGRNTDGGLRIWRVK